MTVSLYIYQQCLDIIMFTGYHQETQVKWTAWNADEPYLPYLLCAQVVNVAGEYLWQQIRCDESRPFVCVSGKSKTSKCIIVAQLLCVMSWLMPKSHIHVRHP